ncbi:hypothetical protein HG530_002762 [Fusarium avenaceum]|nr:hypothetical protein HG530_002762 [Fusarium avenaceum]
MVMRHPLSIPRIIKKMEKSYGEMEISKCRSCQILSTIAIPHFPHVNLVVTSLELEAKLHHSESRHGSVALLTTSYRTSWAQTYVALLSPEVDPEISKIPPIIKDFTWMRNSISRCRQQHSSCLNTAPSLPGLRVIDCLASSCTVAVVAVHDACQYAALSYVWGGMQASITEIPTVIKDAIQVTLELGLRYLWVDQYCIPQNDAQKHRLICVMHKIYGAACVTIVAAAGKTSADGLPGVSSVPRKAQVEIQINGYTLFDLPDARDSAQASTWASRGWTYQEGLLTIDESLQQLVPPETAASMKLKYFLPNLFASTRIDIEQICRRIVHYTERQLSHSQDSLNAFLGIFADYEQQRASLVPPRRPRPEVPSLLSSPLDILPQPSHIWGLPLQLGAPMLEWYHPLPPKERRPAFPSWSWTGWEGGVEFGHSSFTMGHMSTNPIFAATSIEIPNQLKDLHDRKMKGLYVTGATVKLKFATQEQTQSVIEGMKRRPGTRYFPNYDVQTPSHYCLLEVFPGVFVTVRSTMSVKPAPQDQIIGLLVTVGVDKGFCARSMIVLKRCGQNFTRIGFIDADHLWEHMFFDNRGAFKEMLLRSGIRWKYKFVNIDGEFVGDEMLPRSFHCGCSLGQDFVRQRICLE